MTNNNEQLKNFPFEYEGKTYWYSRAAVVGMFAFCKDSAGKWCVLANRRGPGCPSNVGKWNAPGGYVDFGETLTRAAQRETLEETGVKIPLAYIHLCWVDSIPHGRTENIWNRFYAVLPGTTFDWPTSDKYNEPNETTDIQWIPVDELNKYQWAFNHKKHVREMYENHVNPNWKRRIRNWILNKLGANDVKYTI